MDTVSFYRYFIGTMSLVSKQWNNIVNHLKLDRIYNSKNISGFKFILNLLKRGISFEYIYNGGKNCKKLLKIEEGVKCATHTVNLWKKNMNFKDSIIVVNKNDKRSLVCILNAKMNKRNIIANTPEYQTENMTVCNQLSPVVIQDINKQNRYKDIIIFLLLWFNGDRDATSLLKPSNLSTFVMVHPLIYMKEYENILTLNPQLTNLEIICERILHENDIKKPVETMLLDNLIKHSSLKSVHLEIKKCHEIYKGESFEILAKFLNSNSTVEDLKFQLWNFRDSDEFDDTDTIEDSIILPNLNNITVKNSTLKTIKNMSKLASEYSLLPYWASKSSIEVLKTDIFRQEWIDSIIKFHHNLTSLNVKTITSHHLNSILPSLSSLKHLSLTSIIVDDTSNLLNCFKYLNNLVTLSIFTSATEDNSELYVQLMIGLFELELKNLINIELTYHPRIVQSISKNHSVFNLVIDINYGNIDFNHLLNILKKENLESLHYINSCKDKYTEQMTNFSIKYYKDSFNNNIKCLLPDKFTFGIYPAWDLYLNQYLKISK
ncbi:hypothetical protein DLAC_02715 [Tieghemostelium lacteum]|uniref:Uncharacterized protein n=1 Tax=Tieghemostelium lacteum TaxID=361077 RepID=A0A152A376_TIELA|nr:hypothetical protein DLAC_02715 [Tieghemostelium lacteum]|eukprot:KYR00676.1 hypothetical protein DLAC_02715 [Tieghemostelium lacteum]